MHLLEVVLVMLLLIYQDVAYARDLNQDNGLSRSISLSLSQVAYAKHPRVKNVKLAGGAGLLNGGDYINPSGPFRGYDRQPLYVIIYGDGFPPEYGRIYGGRPIYYGCLGPGYSSGFNQPFNGGISPVELGSSVGDATKKHN
jgi:hypothetical protein